MLKTFLYEHKEEYPDLFLKICTPKNILVKIFLHSETKTFITCYFYDTFICKKCKHSPPPPIQFLNEVKIELKEPNFFLMIKEKGWVEIMSYHIEEKMFFDTISPKLPFFTKTHGENQVSLQTSSVDEVRKFWEADVY